MIAGTGIQVGVYGPILPSMLEHNWLSKSQAGYIAAAASLGLLVGAFACTFVAQKRSLGFTARLFLLIGLISMALSAIDFGPIWLGTLRFLSGASTSATSIAINSLITQGIKGKTRGTLIGFAGFGTGFGFIIICATLPIQFINLSSTPANGWLLGTILTAICILIAWPGLHSRKGIAEFPKLQHQHSHHRKGLVLLAICYSIVMFASAPFFIYFSAYISDVFKISADSSSGYYIVIGIGMTLGGLVCDYVLVTFFGRYVSLILAIGIGVASTILLILTNTLWVSLLASFFMSITFSGTSALKTYNILELAGPAAEALWLKIVKIATSITFIAGSFISGLVLSLGWDYGQMFTMVAIALTFSLIIALFIKLPEPVVVHVHDTTK